MESTDAVLFAGKLRQKRNERQLTEELAKICAGDPGLRAGFALALVRVVGSKRSSSLTALVSAAGSGIAIEGQHNLGRVRTAAFRESGGKPDWVISAPGLIIVVEAKIGAGLQEKQLERYLKHPQLVTGEANGGLILLVENRLENLPRLVSRRRHWLGQITWRQLIPELELIEATDSATGDRWRTILDTIQHEGDLGDGAMLWRRGHRTVAQRNRLLLKSVSLSVRHALDGAIRKRFEKLPPVSIYMHSLVMENGQADLDIFIPSSAACPAITISVHGHRRPLSVTLTVHGVAKAMRGDDGTARAARDELTGKGFASTSDVFAITKRFGPPQKNDLSPTEALRSELDPLLSALGASGALDGRVNRWGRRRRKG